MKIVLVTPRDLFRSMGALAEVLVANGHEAMVWDDADFAAQRARAQDAFLLSVWDTKFSHMASATVPQQVRTMGVVAGFSRRIALVLPVDDVIDRDANLAALEKATTDLDEAVRNKVMMLAGAGSDRTGVAICAAWIDKARALAAARNPRSTRFDTRYQDAQVTYGVSRFLYESFDVWLAQPAASPRPATARETPSGPTPPRAASPFVRYEEPSVRNPNAASLPPAPRAGQITFRSSTMEQIEAQLRDAESELETAARRVTARETAIKHAAPGDLPARERELDLARRQLRTATTRVTGLKRQLGA
jgi:hypothetical protein